MSIQKGKQFATRDIFSRFGAGCRDGMYDKLQFVVGMAKNIRAGEEPNGHHVFSVRR